MLKIIVAADKDLGIGKNGEIPWEYPVDLNFFKFMTTSLGSNDVVFGRKTFENIGVPLPNRNTYVLSNKKEGIRSKDPYLKYTTLENFFHVDYDVTSEVYICGGQSVYEQVYDRTDEIIITRVSGYFDCDNFFPDFENDFEFLSEFELRPNLTVQRWKKDS